MTDALAAPVVADVGAALARALGYLGLALLTGSALVPLLDAIGGAPPAAAGSTRSAVERTAWVAIVGALLLLVSAVLRLYWQAAAVVDAGAPVTLADLRLTALQTRWSGRWQLQALAAIVACAIVLVPRRAVPARLVAALLVAGALPLTGHAMSHGDRIPLAVAIQAVHALAASAWLGTLAVLYVDTRRRGLAACRPLWQRFSWLARGAVLAVLLSGLARTWDNIGGELSLLASTPWGLALLVKIALAGAAALTGLLNWRRVLPAAIAANQVTSGLTRSVGLELLFAVAIFTLTGWLTGLPR